MLKVGSTFENSNGREYTVLNQNGRYTIVYDQRKNEYIVAVGLHECEEKQGKYSWASGKYFLSLEGAVEYISK